jgi:hypothetical protein
MMALLIGLVFFGMRRKPSTRRREEVPPPPALPSVMLGNLSPLHHRTSITGSSTVEQPADYRLSNVASNADCHDDATAAPDSQSPAILIQVCNFVPVILKGLRFNVYVYFFLPDA